MAPGERAEPLHLVVGHLTKPHGTKGELYVLSLTDHPEETYVPGVVLSLGKAEDDEPDPDLPPLRIREARPVRDGFLVAFHGVEDRTEAEALRGHYAFRALAELRPLEEGEVFHHQLLGMEVYTVAGEHLGRVREVYELSPSDLLEVQGTERAHMIPFRDGIVVEVDAAGGRLVVDPPEGLLDL